MDLSPSQLFILAIALPPLAAIVVALQLGRDGPHCPWGWSER